MAVYVGITSGITDDYSGERIKVFIPSADKTKTNVNDLEWAYPLIPKMIHIKPKVGEAVFVFTADDEANSKRYYIGPIITQPQTMYYETSSFAMKNLGKNKDDGLILRGIKADDNLSNRSKAFATDEEIALCGRKNSDIILGDDDIKIRCGVHRVSNTNKMKIDFDESNSGYIKLKIYDNPIKTDNGKIESTATIVAQEINLISTKSNIDSTDTTTVNLHNGRDLISDSDMKAIIEKAHLLPYGDVLVEFLETFRTAFLSHTHPWPTIPPCADNSCIKLSDFDIPSILSKHIRIA